MPTDILQGKKIVLLEDDEFLAEVIVRKLTGAGATVSRYRNGLEGLAAIRQLGPDLLLLDIMMPIMNGYEVLDVMVQEQLIDEIPFIVVSNSGQPVEIQRILDLGVKDYVVKVDFTPDEVLDKARIILASSKKKVADTPKNIEPTDSAGGPEAAGAALKVLVVEDDPLLKNLLAVKLTQSGCVPSYIDDGLKVIDQVKTFSPDVILLDLMIPGLDGFGVLEQLQADENFKKIPVFVFSNKSSEADKERAFTLGAKIFKQKAETNLSEVVKELYTLAGKTLSK